MPQQKEEEKEVGTFLYYQERIGGNEIVDKQLEKGRERQLYFDMETIFPALPPSLPCLDLPYSPFIILLFSFLLCFFIFYYSAFKFQP